MVFCYGSPSWLIHDTPRSPHQVPSISSSSRIPCSAHFCPEAGPELEAWGREPWSLRKISQNHNFLTVYMEKFFIRGELDPSFPMCIDKLSFSCWVTKFQRTRVIIIDDKRSVPQQTHCFLPINSYIAKYNTEYNTVSRYHTWFHIKWFSQNTFIFTLSDKD